MTALAPSLASFLREHLPRERNASPHTVASYAHAFSLLLRYAANRLGRRPTDLTIEDLDPDLILGFLSHVEQDRCNTARSRNARFAAIRSFFRYLEYKVPACLEQALRVRSLPMKKTDKALRPASATLYCTFLPRRISGSCDIAARTRCITIPKSTVLP